MDADVAALPRPELLADPARRAEGRLVDALAYVDDEIDYPGMRDAVNSLILDEMAHYPAPDYAAEMRPLPFETASEALQSELSRIAAGGAFVRQDRDRLTSLRAPAEGASPAEWDAALDRARIVAEEQTLATINLELMQRYGAEAWKLHVGEVDAIQTAMRRRVAAIAARVDEVNAARKRAQEPQGARLKTLTRRWEQAVATNIEIEGACADAEREVKRLKALARAHGLGVPGEEEGGTAAAAGKR